MVIDSSAIVAILKLEPEARLFLDRIANSEDRLCSSVTLVETGLVMESHKGRHGGIDLDQLVFEHQIEIVPFSLEHAQTARAAWRKYGRGNHPARLNFGDCCTYALAKLTGEPLLFKGTEFYKTDITPVIPAP